MILQKELFKLNSWLKLYLVEDLHRFVELYIPQEGGQILEEVNQQLSIHGPPLETHPPSLFKTSDIQKQKHHPRLTGWVEMRRSYLLLGCVCEHPGDEDAMGDQFKPGVHKTGSFGWSQDVERVAAEKSKKFLKITFIWMK